MGHTDHKKFTNLIAVKTIEKPYFQKGGSFLDEEIFDFRRVYISSF